MGATLAAGESAELQLDPSRHVYLVAAQGPIEVNGVRAEPRDGIAITGEEKVTIKALEECRDRPGRRAVETLSPCGRGQGGGVRSEASRAAFGSATPHPAPSKFAALTKTA